MHDELRAISDEFGVFLRRDALELGHSDRTLARALRARVIHRVRHGAYVFTDEWVGLDSAEQHAVVAKAVLRTAKTNVVISHTTALVLAGVPVWGLPLAEVHVTRLDRKSGRREAGVAQHRGLLRPTDITRCKGLPVTSPTRTALDLTTITDVEHSLPVLDHLLHTGQTSTALLRTGSTAMRAWANTLTTDLAISLADGRAESVGESRSRYVFWRGGLPAPVPQYDVHDSRGRLIARVDFAWPHLGLFVEFDGKEKYTKFLRPGETTVDAVLREKRREELICELTGWRCLRITWADLFDPDRVVARIERAMTHGVRRDIPDRSAG